MEPHEFFRRIAEDAIFAAKVVAANALQDAGLRRVARLEKAKAEIHSELARVCGARLRWRERQRKCRERRDRQKAAELRVRIERERQNDWLQVYWIERAINRDHDLRHCVEWPSRQSTIHGGHCAWSPDVTPFWLQDEWCAPSTMEF